MEVTTFSKSQFEKLKKYDPGKHIISTECELFLIGSERNKKNKRKLLKKFYIEEGEYLGRKLLNLNTLIYYHNSLTNIEEFVLPETLAIVNGQIIGYTMPFIEKSANLETLLKDNNITLKDKIEYLKQVGKILEKIENIKDFPHEFHLGDMHEANFIIDELNNIKVVDLDSSYISNNKPFHSKYLFLNHLLTDYPYKYKINEDGDIIPSRNSDLYCYIIMLLNTLSGTKMYTISLHRFYSYMTYLEDLGIPKKLLFCIENIYHNGENENPLYYLDEIPIDKSYQANHLVYKQKTGVDLTKY